MNRRHFLSASALATTSAAVPFDGAGAKDTPIDYSLVERKLQNTISCARSTEGDNPEIELHVTLVKRDPEGRWNGRIARFDLNWEGESIPIPKRFWDDLDGLEIETYPPIALANIPDGQMRRKAERAVHDLSCPRLVLSQDKGTVFIEWSHPAECDSRSTIRWIVSKSGSVLRNRETPYHER